MARSQMTTEMADDSRHTAKCKDGTLGEMVTS